MNISIIMPIYNEELLLRKTLEYYEKLVGNDFELILVNDGSTDGSGEICDEFSKKYDFIKVIHKENEGCVAARKTGIEESNGKYIVFVDADDFIDSDYLSNIRKAIKNDADYYILNNKVNTNINKQFKVEKNFIKDGYIDRIQALEWIVSGKTGAVWDKIFVADIIKKNNINFECRLNYGDDVYINLTYLKFVDRVYVQNTSSYNHYIDSVTSLSLNNINYNRLDEINLLYQEGISILNNSYVSERIIGKFISVEIANFVKTIAELQNAGEKSRTIRNKIKNYPIYKECKIIINNGIVSMVYCILLKYKLVKLSKVICNLRVKRI